MYLNGRKYITNQMPIAIGNTITRQGNIPAPSMSAGETAIRAGNTVGWYCSDDLTTITKDGADHITAWRDKLLSGTHDLDSYTGTPHLSTDGVLFDGIDDTLYSSVYTLNQPTFIYAVVRQITWTNNDAFFDGTSSFGGTVQQYSSSPNIYAYAGGVYPLDANLAVNTWGIIRVLFNGASSKLIVNANTPTTGNFGAGVMSGLTLGSIGGHISNFGNVEYKEFIQRNVADNATDEANIYAYLKAKYSL